MSRLGITHNGSQVYLVADFKNKCYEFRRKSRNIRYTGIERSQC